MRFFRCWHDPERLPDVVFQMLSRAKVGQRRRRRREREEEDDDDDASEEGEGDDDEGLLLEQANVRIQKGVDPLRLLELELGWRLELTPASTRRRGGGALASMPVVIERIEMSRTVRINGIFNGVVAY